MSSVGPLKPSAPSVSPPAIVAVGNTPPRTPFAAVLRTATKAAHASASGPVPHTVEAPIGRMPGAPTTASHQKLDAHARLVGERRAEERKRHAHADDLKAPDAHDRHLAQLAPPAGFLPVTESAATGVQQTLHASVEALLPQLCTQIAWAREGKRNGHTQMTIGHGPLAGSTLLVTAHEGKVSVQIEAAAGIDGAAWTRRLHSALEQRGLTVDHA